MSVPDQSSTAEGLGVLAAFWRSRTVRTQRRAAVAAVVRNFESAGRRAIRGMCGVVGQEPRGAVVRVCYGDTRPPGRAWFVVGPVGVVAELTWAEAERLGERPWR